jgi:hypothetical protein
VLFVGLALIGFSGVAAGSYSPPANGPAVSNPCTDERALELACPDLRMAKPRGLYLTGHRLHAVSTLKSRGTGPLVLRGTRNGPRTMSVAQVIYKRGGGALYLPTNARLVFYHVPGLGPYWKLQHAASFELWTIGADGGPDQLLRTGPKIDYCLRDLARTKPSPDSPRHRVHPACSQNPHLKHRILGTSVGWSDIYPASYDKNWINVGGLNGCFWFVQRADPENYLYEANTLDNAGMRRIKLPVRHGRVRRC